MYRNTITEEFVPTIIKKYGTGICGLISTNSMFTEFVEKNPDLPWPWNMSKSELKQFKKKYFYSLCYYINKDHVEKYIEHAWKKTKKDLRKCKHITPKIVEKYIDKDWDWGEGGLSSNPCITVDFIKAHIDEEWDWGEWGLSSNPNITVDFIEDNIEKDWSWKSLSSNPNITLEFVEKYIEKNWHFPCLKCVTTEFVESHLDRDWNFFSYSCSSYITCEFIRAHPEIYWNWGEGGLSSNPNITCDFVKEYIDMEWDWGVEGLSSLPDLTLDFIEEYIDEEWDWNEIKILTNEFIERHPEIFDRGFLGLSNISLDKIGNNIYWEGMSCRKDVTCKFIKDHIDKSWNWGYNGLSNNPNIDVDFVLKNIEKSWDIVTLFSNTKPCKYMKLTREFKEELCSVAYGEKFPMGKMDRESVEEFFTDL